MHDYDVIENRIVFSNIRLVIRNFTQFLDIVTRYAEEKTDEPKERL